MLIARHTVLGMAAILISSGAVAFGIHNRAPKFGYAETPILLSEFSESIEARKKFETAQQEWDRNLKGLNDSLLASMDRMKEGYGSADKAGKERLRADLQRRNEDLQRYTNAVKKLSQEKEKEVMDPVIGKINSYLDVWGRENGYDMVFGTVSGGNILQASKSMNVTRKVLQGLNEQYKQAPEDSQKPAAPSTGGLGKGKPSGRDGQS